jgi:Ca2+:H+ antiporter
MTASASPRASAGVRLFFQTPLDWLVLAVPAAFAIRFVPAWSNESLLFVVSGVGIIPLAGWLGRATEQISARTGAGFGGFLNATFGNAAELIIALMALSKGLTTVVKASLTGSIIGNLLLVLGASAFAGGLRFSHQRFNKTAARVSATAMSMGAAALIIPTVFHVTANARPGGWSAAAEQKLSLAIAVVLFLTYVATLLFSLKTHKALFVGQSEAEKHEPTSSLARAVMLLGMATILIAFLSEFLVGSIEAARQSLGLTQTFVGVIVVALVGNAAEHTTAIWAALKNKMDLSLNIAVGSSLQIALFVTPMLVFASYAFSRPMDLEFSLPEIVAIAVAIWIAQQISGDGESNWLEGVQLLSVYVIMAILFFFLPETVHPNPADSPTQGPAASQTTP